MNVLSYVPAHRYLLVAGKVPKWTRYLEGQPRELPSDNVPELAAAIQSTFGEEIMGRRPTQFVYFDVTTKIYETVLKSIPTGWVGTTENLDLIIRSLSLGIESYSNVDSGGITAFHLGKRPEDLTFERRFLEKVCGRPKLVASFLVQKKFAEIHLAGTAVMGILEESPGPMTQAELEQLFELEAGAAEKMFDLIHAEYGMDIRKYLKFPKPEVVETVNKLADLKHVTAVAALEDGTITRIKKLRTTEITIFSAARILARAYEQIPKEFSGGSSHMHLASSEGNQVVVTSGQAAIYAVFLTKDARLGLMVRSILEVIAENG